VFIDDLPENIEGAHSLGMSVILYRPAVDLEAELKKLDMTI
jgi:FMN phosphatase YigB (HAD superfamily)